MLLLAAVFICSGFPLLASSDDNLELLSTSLRQLHRAGCTELSLSCPQGTSIVLVSAKYTEGLICPGQGPSQGCQLTLPSSLQYSLLQTAVERCQKKRSCKFQPASISFDADPCPGLVKHLSLAYGCRPYEFRSKTACENEVVQLQCGPNTRLAIYSASYGRTQYESLQCPQPLGVPEETCLASYATEIVISLCHGKRRCTLSVDSGTFGNPCKKESRMYLKVVYTCVVRRVLKPTFEEGPQSDEPIEPEEEWADYEEEELAAPNTIAHHSTNTSAASVNESVTLFHNRAGYETTSEPEEEEVIAGKVRREGRQLEDTNCTLTVYTEAPRSRVIGFFTDWVNVYYFLSNNKERLTLYLVVSIGGGLTCLLTLLALRLACRRRRQEEGLPPYLRDIYPGETDLGLAPGLSHIPGEVVRYSAMDMPRSLAAANSQYYYG